MISTILPKSSTVARAMLAPAVAPAVRDWVNPYVGLEDSVDFQGDIITEGLAKGAGIACGTLTGLATTAICAANYPVAAICVGTATCAAILNSKEAQELPVPAPAAALAGGVVAAAYAPAVAGAVVAVSTEEVVTAGVRKFLNRNRERS